MPLTPLSGILGRKRATHILHRATFGANKQTIDAFASLTAQQAVTQLFQPLPQPEPPIDILTNETWVSTPPSDANSEDGDLQEFFKGWWIGQMMKNEVSAREKIVFFLHTHFTTNQEKVNNSRAFYFQNALFRKFAFDAAITDPDFNFKVLAKKICLDNAMLQLLDNRQNVKGALNENYAREFLELYTVGRGKAGVIPPTTEEGDYFYFTEQDVRAAAAILSGYEIDDTFVTLDEDTELPKGTVVLNGEIAIRHDNDPKEFSARMGNVVITPDSLLLVGGQPTEESVLDELDQLVDLIFDQAETARNICRKIYRFFVYYDITDTVENTIIPEMVNTFTSNNFKIEPVIRELLQSQHFYEAGGGVNDDNFGAIIRSPLDLILGTYKFFEVELPDYLTDTENFYKTTGNIVSLMQPQGLNLLNPYDVAGYDAYHQYPIYNRSWISTNSLTQRYNFIFKTMRQDDMIPEGEIQIDLLSFMKLRFATNALNPPVFIRELASYLLPLSSENTEITTERLNYFEQQFLKLGSGLPQGALAFWQFSWSNAATVSSSELDARGMLQDLINAMLQSPEYQLF